MVSRARLKTTATPRFFGCYAIRELRALTSLARAWQAEPRAAGLLQRLGVVLEQLTLQCDGADAREARSLLRESQRNPATIP